MARVLTVVVLAAGLGTRFHGVKQLAPVGPHGEAIMDLLLRRAADAGFERGIIIVRSEIHAAVEAHVAAFEPSVPVEYVEQTQPLGTAHAVLATRSVVDGPFAVVNADDLYPADAFDALGRQLTANDEHALVAFRVGRTLVGDRPVTRAAIEFDATGRLLAVTEATVHAGPDLDGDRWVSMNMWGFQPRVFDPVAQAVDEFLAERRAGEILLPDVVEGMVERGERFRVLCCESPCIGITHPDDVAVVRRALA